MPDKITKSVVTIPSKKSEPKTTVVENEPPSQEQANGAVDSRLDKFIPALKKKISELSQAEILGRLLHLENMHDSATKKYKERKKESYEKIKPKLEKIAKDNNIVKNSIDEDPVLKKQLETIFMSKFSKPIRGFVSVMVNKISNLELVENASTTKRKATTSPLDDNATKNTKKRDIKGVTKSVANTQIQSLIGLSKTRIVNNNDETRKIFDKFRNEYIEIDKRSNNDVDPFEDNVNMNFF